MIALCGDELAVNSLLRSLNRLFQENPAAMGTFAAWLEAPGHSDSITLNFYNRRLNTIERRQIVKQ